MDNIFTNVAQSANTINSGSFKTQFSDHYSIFCITDLVQNTENEKYISKRDFSNKNISNFNKSLKAYDWSKLYTEGLYKEKFTSFQNKFIEIFNENYKHRYIKLGYKNRLPFITNGLRKSIQHKHDLWQLYVNNPSDENLNN